MSFISSMTIFMTLLTIMISIIILLENRNPSKTVAWLLVLILLPVVGIFIYFYVGQNHRKKKTFIKKRKHDYLLVRDLLKEEISNSQYKEIIKESFSDQRSKMIPLLINNTSSPITVNNDIKVLNNGEETYQHMLEAISNAKHHIHMEYFIINDSNIAHILKNALIEKSKEGVMVRLIYDAVGCWKLPKGFFYELQRAGVHVKPFLPVTFPFFGSRLNYRNHRKILIIDGKEGFLGGINIGDEYLGLSKKFGFWRDTHLKVRGEVVYILQAIFLMDWFFVSGEEIDHKDYFPKQGYCGEKLMQIAASGPDSYWPSIHQAYFTAIASAESRVYIVTPYLIPDESIIMALKTAALSGVDVRIILPGKPDHKTVFWASRSHFIELLEAGVRIYEYKKGFIHSKIIITDQHFVSIGTANLDMRSFRLNFEVNGFIYDDEVNKSITAEFLKDLENSQEVLMEAYINRPLTCRIKESIARLFSPIL